MHRHVAVTQSELQSLIGLLRSGQPGEAERQAAQLLARAPEQPTLHFLMGMALLNQNRAEDAITSYRQALVLKPDYLDAAKNLGSTLHRLGRLVEAIAVYEEARARHPGDAALLEQLGMTLEAQNDAERATGLYAQALALDPARFFARVNLGLLLARDNKLPDAVTHLRTALATREHASVHLHLGNALRLLGRHAEAVAHLERAVALKPAQTLGLAYLAIAHQEAGMSAVADLDRILELPVSDSDDASMHMWAALKLERPEQAFAFRPAQINVMDFADLDRLARRDVAADIAALPPLGGTQPDRSSRPIVTAGASGDYAEKFAAPLIESVLAHCPDASFHLHVMNAGAYDPGAALSQYPHDRVTWSGEEIPGADRVVYSTRRFVRLAHTLRQSGKLIVSLDIDALARGNFLEAIGRNFDALVFERHDMPWAHQMINAGFLALTPGGQPFIDFVAAYILQFETAGAARWYLDQIGMVAARSWLARRQSQIRIAQAAATIMDWRSDAGSLIWHFKGGRKPR
jgi:tetratricopeptide (TPR) repeat protein